MFEVSLTQVYRQCWIVKQTVYLYKKPHQTSLIWDLLFLVFSVQGVLKYFGNSYVKTAHNSSIMFYFYNNFLVIMDANHTDFFKDVFDVVRLIPKGRVTSYGAIANYLGTKKSSRIVGYAMNKAHTDGTIPAHRVVNRKGVLSGKNHFATPNRMQELLENEGILVKDNSIQNFEQVFWDPSIELKL